MCKLASEPETSTFTSIWYQVFFYLELSSKDTSLVKSPVPPVSIRNPYVYYSVLQLSCYS